MTPKTLRSFAVCSDVQVGRRRVAKDDIAEISTLDLAFPATTDASTLRWRWPIQPLQRMTVIFATYQSIQTISEGSSSSMEMARLQPDHPRRSSSHDWRYH